MSEAGIWIEGRAAGFDLDRESELFAPGAFDAGIKSFMENPVLAFSHARTIVDTVNGPSRYVQLGAVTQLDKRPDGLYVKAWLPRPRHSNLLADIYEQVKSGIMRGLSVGGRFLKRGAKIVQADLHEVSIAAKPVFPGALITKVWPADVAPVLPGPVLSAIGTKGKADPGSYDLNLALHSPQLRAELAGQIAELGSGLRELARGLPTAEMRDMRRDLDRIRARAGLD